MYLTILKFKFMARREKIITSWHKNSSKFANLKILFCSSTAFVVVAVVVHYCCGEFNE